MTAGETDRTRRAHERCRAILKVTPGFNRSSQHFVPRLQSGDRHPPYPSPSARKSLNSHASHTNNPTDLHLA